MWKECYEVNTAGGRAERWKDGWEPNLYVTSLLLPLPVGHQEPKCISEAGTIHLIERTFTSSSAGEEDVSELGRVVHWCIRMDQRWSDNDNSAVACTVPIPARGAYLAYCTYLVRFLL